MVLAIQALGFAAFAVVELTSTNPTRLAVGVGASVFLLVYAALLALSGWGLWRGRRLARGFAVTAQVIHLFVGYSFVSGQPGLGSLLTGGVVMMVTAIVVGGVCVLLPSSTKRLIGQD